MATKLRISNSISISTVEDGQDGQPGQDGRDGKDAHEVQPNLLLRTVFDRGIDFVKEEWTSDKWGAVSIDSQYTVEGRKSLRFTYNGSTTEIRQDVRSRVMVSTWYTLSFCYFATQSWRTFVTGTAACVDVSAGCYVDGVFQSVPADGKVEWPADMSGRRHTFTFKTLGTLPVDCIVYFRAMTDAVYLCMPKLEVGDTATAYMAHEDDLVGEQGERGKTGRMYYYAGEWEAFTAAVVVSDTQCPFFGYTYGTHQYAILMPPVNGTFTKAQIISAYGNPWENGSAWQLMEGDFKYIITEAVFGEFAKFGSAVISGDWMLSACGVIYDTTDVAHVIDSTYSWDDYTVANAYTLFDAAYPSSSKPSEDNFVPTYAVDLLTGEGFFGTGKIRFRADGSGQLADGKISWDASGNADFEGVVNGYFNRLTTISNGTSGAAAIRFGGNELMYFEGDILHNGTTVADGRNYRFYAATLYCRAVFGAARYSTLLVNGVNGVFFIDGTLQNGITVEFKSSTDARGNTYYEVFGEFNQYTSGGKLAGCSVCNIVFDVSTNYNYHLKLNDTQKVTLINTSKTQGVGIYSNGQLHTLQAREVQEAVQLPSVMFTSAPTGLGAGLMLGAYYQNDNW